MRIKLRQNQSTLPIEKIEYDISTLEIIAPSIEKLPSLTKFQHLKSFYINTPNLIEISDLPMGIEILKMRSFNIKISDLEKIMTLDKLKILEIVDTSITKMPNDFFKHFTQLESLSLKGNQLKDLPCIKNCTKLTRLNLDNNQFEKLPNTLLDNSSINHLSLDHNQFNEEEKNKIFKMFGIWF